MTAGPLTRTALLENYEWPAGEWVRSNFVVSIDGSITRDGTSASMSGPADNALLHHLRSTADVVVVGARTASAENYIGVFPPGGETAFPNRHDDTPAPPLAVVTHSGVIGSPRRFLTKTIVDNFLVLTSDEPAALAAARAAVDESAGTMTLIHAPGGIAQAVDRLHELGLRRILCEGGPSLVNALAVADLVDEYCVTLSSEVGGEARRSISSVPATDFIPVFNATSDRFVFTRWRRSPRNEDR